MTNAEKYQEVFGFPPDKGNCPTEYCNQCPCKQIDKNGCLTYETIFTNDWWDEEYKGGAL